MKIAGIVVNNNMNIIELKLKGYAFEFDSTKSSRNILREKQIDVFKTINELERRHFSDIKRDKENRITILSRQPLSNYPLYNSKHDKIDNTITLKGIFQNEGKIMGAEIYIPAFNKTLNLKLNDLIYLNSFCIPSNFSLRQRNGNYFFAGKNGSEIDKIPIKQKKEFSNIKQMSQPSLTSENSLPNISLVKQALDKSKYDTMKHRIVVSDAGYKIQKTRKSFLCPDENEKVFKGYYIAIKYQNLEFKYTRKIDNREEIVRAGEYILYFAMKNGKIDINNMFFISHRNIGMFGTAEITEDGSQRNINPYLGKDSKESANSKTTLLVILKLLNKAKLFNKEDFIHLNSLIEPFEK